VVDALDRKVTTAVLGSTQPDGVLVRSAAGLRVHPALVGVPTNRFFKDPMPDCGGRR
jgi:hypothetical protein